MFTAVLFDLDNTLIDRDAAFRRLVCATFRCADAIIDELQELDGSGYGDRTRLLRRWFDLGGGRFDPREFGLLIAQFVTPQSDLLQALSRLSETVSLGIITNGSTDTQSAKWRAAGLDEVIPSHRLWISESVGIKKPEPEIFRIACTGLQVEPAGCLYIGDQPCNDIKAATAAGLPTRLATSPLTSNDLAQLGKSIDRCVGSAS